jgi:hypothetical protein
MLGILSKLHLTRQNYLSLKVYKDDHIKIGLYNTDDFNLHSYTSLKIIKQIFRICTIENK